MSFEGFGFHIPHPGERWCEELESPPPIGIDPKTGENVYKGDECLIRIGIDPETGNPIHYGQCSAIIEYDVPF